MLILNRRPGEALLIDGGIRVIVLSCDRHGARIGIEAPASVNIQREELRQRDNGGHEAEVNGPVEPA